MWKIEYSSQVAAELKIDFAKGLLTKEDITVIKAWALEIQEYGPEYIQKSRLWDDHALEKEWIGHRSSCFSLKGRIIYRVESDKILIMVVKITGSHDYRKSKK
jgi:mRNA-degrading endonuclease YafQ of YafQ-DinJ toxin-antitoxin module